MDELKLLVCNATRAAHPSSLFMVGMGAIKKLAVLVSASAKALPPPPVFRITLKLYCIL